MYLQSVLNIQINISAIEANNQGKTECADTVVLVLFFFWWYCQIELQLF